jgi:hypothetical protein
MKKVLFAAFLLVSSNAIFAQINQGQWLAGGTIGFNSEKQGDVKATMFNISPDAGYFFINNFAGGLRLDYTSTKVKGADDASSFFSVAPFVRYYFLPAAQKVNVFADAAYGFGKGGYDKKQSLNYYSIMAGPAVFLTPNTALELDLYYRSNGGDYFENAAGDKDNHFGFKIGFQVHLGGGAKK